MANVFQQSGYQGSYVGGYQYFLKHSHEHKVIKDIISTLLPKEVPKVAEGQFDFSVLGVGSGGGELDVHLLSILQSTLPVVSVRTEIVEPSTELIRSFQELVVKTSRLQSVPFEWHNLTCAEYETQVRTRRDLKKFDLIHMIQMLYYVDDPASTLKFFHSLLAEKGKLLIVHEAAGGGFDTLWKTFKKELCTMSLSDYLSAGDLKVILDTLGLRYEEHTVRNTVDITECFVEGSKEGALLLNFMTDREDFQSSFSAEVRAGIMELLRNKCSTVKNGRVLFDCSLTALLVHA